MSDGSGPKNTDLGWARDGPGLKPFHESCAWALDKPLNSLIKMLRLLGPFPKVGLGLFQVQKSGIKQVQVHFFFNFWVLSRSLCLRRCSPEKFCAKQMVYGGVVKKSKWFTWRVGKKSMMIHMGGRGSKKYPKNDPHGL